MIYIILKKPVGDVIDLMNNTDKKNDFIISNSSKN